MGEEKKEKNTRAQKRKSEKGLKRSAMGERTS